jgi:UDP-N-acetylmuramoyl-tripeptide--D-alanyl-D-alanine ligase
MLIEELYNIYRKNPVICTDSRNILSGCIFFALKGANFNGNLFAAEALNKGAGFAIIDDPKYKANNNCILVDDVLITLQHLANYHRNQLGIPIIAITGTNGKTTTKELFTAVFAKKFKVSATTGNLNNHIGVPVTLLSMNTSTEIGIVEMGANHLNEISTLCSIAEPDYGLITNIGKAHLEGFGNLNGVIKAKTELYSYLEKFSGTIFYNADNPVLIESVNKFNCNKIAYGLHKGSFFTAQLCLTPPFLGFTINITIDADKISTFKFHTHLVGDYNLENALAAICAGMFFKIPVANIKNALEEYVPTNFRSQFKTAGTNKFLLDFYNANPSSMEVTLNNFSNIQAPGLKKVIVLGEMLELGKESNTEHLKIIQLLESLGFKDVFLVGNGFQQNKNGYYKYFNNSDLLKEYLNSHKFENAYFLIKGSRGVKLEKILDCF